MIINPKETCLVLDLDDTLYKEFDYQTSGLKYIEDQVSKLYKINLNGKLLQLRQEGVNDIFLELSKILNLPNTVKNSFISMYRYHKPKISLSIENKKFLDHVLITFGQVVILTDGRSISQRLKISALGLTEIPVYISEEWNSRKPNNKRFIAIMKKYSFLSQFCYIGDNLTKDFIAPNSLNWTSICLKGDKTNIHKQAEKNIKKENLPNYWINNLNEIILC